MAKRLSWLLFAAVVALAVYCGAKCTMLKIRVAFAEEQLQVFEQMVASAKATSDPGELCDYLRYTSCYYTSGSKQVAGSRLDRIVETARANAVGRIIDELRAATGDDLGNDPSLWLDKYGRAAH